MDYSTEPEHSNLLNIQEKQPFNAEPTAASLVEFSITPEDLVYCRNHGPVREFDEEGYYLELKGGLKGYLRLGMRELRELFDPVDVVAALQVCLLH